MPENEFEKQVRQTMEAFRLQPSEPVWPEIERQIREKKRRRLVFFIPLLAGLLLLGYGGYRGLIGKQNKLSVVKQNNVQPNGIENQFPAGQQSNLPGDKVQQSLPFTHQSSKEITKTLNKEANTQKIRNVNHELFIQKQKDRGTGDYAEAISKKITAISNKPYKAANNKIGKLNDLDAYTVATDEKLENRKQFISKVMLVNIIREDSGGMLLRNMMMDLHLAGITTVQNGTVRHRKRLNWAVDLSAGLSNRSQRSAGIFSANTASFNSRQPAAGGVNGFAITQPSGVQPGLGLKAGIVVKKGLSSGLSIITGLRYTYLSDRINIGNTVYGNFRSNNGNYYNLAVQPYSAGFQARHYNNRYHFIELPVTIQTAINKRSRYPLLWDVGFSVSRLVATNALLYDGSNGGFYYEGKNAMKKNIVNFVTGVSISFGRNQQRLWRFGPEVSLGLTPYLKNGYNKQAYPLFGGLKISYLLGNQKKN
jgi:hypothetical protein